MARYLLQISIYTTAFIQRYYAHILAIQPPVLHDAVVASGDIDALYRALKKMIAMLKLENRDYHVKNYDRDKNLNHLV